MENREIVAPNRSETAKLRGPLASSMTYANVEV